MYMLSFPLHNMQLSVSSCICLPVRGTNDVFFYVLVEMTSLSVLPCTYWR